MSNLVGRKSVEVSIKDLRGNAVPRWNAQDKCWENIVIDSQLAAPFPFHFDFSDVVPGKSKYIKIINACRIEYELPGEAYCEKPPSEDIEFKISYIRSGSNYKFATVTFKKGENFGDFDFLEEDQGLIQFDPQTDDVLYVTAPNDLWDAENISITIFGLVTLPVGRADAKFLFTELTDIDLFETEFDETSGLESPASEFQLFYLQALNLGEATDDVIVKSTLQKLEFSTDNINFSEILRIQHSGEILTPVSIYVRLKKGAYKIDDSYYEENISTENVFTLQDTIRVEHEKVTSPGNHEVDYIVTVPALTNPNTLVLKVDATENTAFTVNRTILFGDGSSLVRFANVNTPLVKTEQSITTSSSGATITFPSPGVYIVDLGTGVDGIGGYDEPNDQIIDVLRFGENKTYRADLQGFFKNCTGITEFTASKRGDYPTFAEETNATDFFRGATNFNDPYLNEWDILNINNLSGFLRDAESFNQSLGKWQFNNDIKADKDNGIFLDSGISQKNANLSFIGWGNYAIYSDKQFTVDNILDVGTSSTTTVQSDYEDYEVTNPKDNGTAGLFELGQRDLTIISSNINQQIRLADNGVTVIAGDADFGQENEINGVVYVVRDVEQQGDVAPINKDNASTSVTSKVTDMSGLFEGEILFGGDQTISIQHWDTSNVTNMSNMFKGADFGENYNESIAIWDVSNVTNFGSMFENSVGFNTDLTYWNVSSVSQPATFSEGSDLEERFIPKWGATYTPLPLTIKKAKAAYSLRYVSPAYVGKPVIQVTNGNTDYDLTMYDLLDNESFNAAFDVAANNQIKIKKLYDQSGEGIDFNEDENSGPLIAVLGESFYELVTEKNKAAMFFGGASEYLVTNNEIYSSDLLSFIVGTTQESTDTNDHTFLYLANATNNDAYQVVKTKASTEDFTPNSFASIKVSDTIGRIQYSNRGYLGNFLFTSVFKGAFPSEIYIDGVNIEGVITGDYSFTKGNYAKSVIGGVSDNSSVADGTYFAGKIQEILIYNEELDKQTIDSIESSLNSYYILFDIDQFVDKVTDDDGTIFVANKDVEQEHHVTVYNEVAAGTLPFVLCPCNAGKEQKLYNINPT